MLSNKVRAELSEIVDGIICGSCPSSWDSMGDFTEEILSELESERDLTSEEHEYCSSLCEDYWFENQHEEDSDEE